MSKKKINRLRVFAGPNGSGKSTVFRNINRSFQIGHYINADDLERALKDNKFVNLYDFGISVEKADFQNYIANSTLLLKAKQSGLDISLSIQNNIVLANQEKVHSYEAALLAAFLREKLIESNHSLSFETVMSHPSKLEVMEIADKNHYRNYLYFICTDAPSINVNRVQNRVIKGGHAVPDDKIISRCYKSLSLLPATIRNTYRTFIFDNSGNKHQLIL